MKPITSTFIFLSLLLSAAIFGFFYAWVCSTMWGLDAVDPRVAIKAMQAMNASVRNLIFAPAFFATPFVTSLTAAFLWREGHKRGAGLFITSASVYFLFGLLLTMNINVPMNVNLAGVTVPQDIELARGIWADYSPRWQFWNQARTVASGLSFLLALAGVMSLVPNQSIKTDE